MKGWERVLRILQYRHITKCMLFLMVDMYSFLYLTMLSHLLFLFLGEKLSEWRVCSGQILMSSDKGPKDQTMGVTCLKIP